MEFNMEPLVTLTLVAPELALGVSIITEVKGRVRLDNRNSGYQIWCELRCLVKRLVPLLCKLEPWFDF